MQSKGAGETTDEGGRALQSRVPGIAEGLPVDDEELEVVHDESQSANDMKDPFTLAPLKKEDDGYPLQLGCGHTYNRSTIFDKKKGNTYSLDTCAGTSIGPVGSFTLFTREPSCANCLWVCSAWLQQES